MLDVSEASFQPIAVMICATWSGKQKAVHDGRSVQRFALMNSFYFLADTKVLGIAFNFWKIIGLSGSLIFGLRFLIQWIASERAQKSVIPFGFWECSALGSFLLLAYFAIYRHDSVGVLQSILPLPIYLRNLYFRYTHHVPKHAGAAPRVEE